LRIVLILAWLALLTSAWGQSSSSDQPSQSGAVPATVPVGERSSDNPPISGLDLPSLQPPFQTRSFVSIGAHISEAADSNVGEGTGNSSISEDTRALGSVMLQRIGVHSVTAVDYIGGIIYYSDFTPNVNQIHQADAEQKFLWRTGQLTARDQFSYLPEGSFGYGVYGESGAYDLGIGGLGYLGGVVGEGLGGIFSLGEFGALGQAPRYSNFSIVDLDQGLSKRSSITLAGGYGLIRFTGNSPSFIDNNQITAQAGYDYQISRRSQIALVYGFQQFEYPNIPGSSFHTHIGQFMYGYRISGRMDLMVGAGPQVTVINNSMLFGGSSDRITASARGILRYRFPKTSLGLYYDRYNTSGSGYFLGAVSDIVRFSISRPLGRRWTISSDVGYARNERIEPGFVGVLPSTTSSFWYLYAGAAVRRQMSHSLSLFLSYQYNDLTFGESFCATPGCNTMAQRHVAAIGLDWRPHPFRLD
jgi:hypothetical protein